MGALDPAMRIEDAILGLQPGFRWGVVVAEGLEVAEPAFGAAAADALAEASERCRAAAVAGAERPAADPRIAAWRTAFSGFGASPGKHPPSVEALVRRVGKGGQIPFVNAAVAAFNAVSLRFVTPVGADDLDRVAGEPRLAVAAGGEAFRAIGADPDAPDDPAAAGEVVYRDDDGVLCRRWCWRQGARTAVSEASRRVLFNVPTLPPFAALDDALEALVLLVAPYADRVTTGVLDADRPALALT